MCGNSQVYRLKHCSIDATCVLAKYHRIPVLITIVRRIIQLHILIGQGKNLTPSNFSSLENENHCSGYRCPGAGTEGCRVLLVRRGQGCPVLVAAGSSTPRAQLSPSATMVAPLGKYIFKRAKTSQKPVIHREEERKERAQEKAV